MEISELKKAVHKDLTANNEKELKKRIKENSNLKEVTAYTVSNPGADKFIEDLIKEGIKVTKKDLKLYSEIKTTIQMNTSLVIVVNKNYLVQGRDFQNVKQCIAALKHYANPDFVNPPFEDQLLQSIKNLNFNMTKNIQNLSRQLLPVIKILSSLAEEDEKENAKKNN